MSEKKKKPNPAPDAAENTSPAEGGAAEEAAAEDIERQLEALQKQLDSANDKLLRTLAEYDNYRKRSVKEKESIYPEAKCDVAVKILPVLDNFERALSAPCQDAEFKRGVEMIFQSLSGALAAAGVEEIPSTGEAFDPNLHNAVMHIEDEALGENVVAEVLQKGYRLGDRVIRHAMVKVAN
ncbi:MAG: nucleotide exchange factor GrpE [Oscillospiraceae bacterium]|nr:nucleotide exchange factor GrpE [Oscillospiraceae bacterium]